VCPGVTCRVTMSPRHCTICKRICADVWTVVHIMKSMNIIMRVWVHRYYSPLLCLTSSVELSLIAVLVVTGALWISECAGLICISNGLDT
jgi:hypothetical protein